jgi:hypothetical protein
VQLAEAASTENIWYHNHSRSACLSCLRDAAEVLHVQALQACVSLACNKLY